MISKINSLRDSFLQAFQQQQTNKQKLLKEITQEGLQDENELNDASLFTQQGAKSQDSSSDIVAERYINIANNFESITEESYSPNSISNLLASYMSSSELDVMMDYVDGDDMSKDSIDDLTDKISTSDEDEAPGLINEFLGSSELEPGTIFAVLTYLYEEFSKRKNKRAKLLGLLQQLLEKFSQQNSAYLAEMFQMQNHPGVKSNPKLAAGMAKLAAGDISINSLKNAITFVEEHLDGDLKNIVSKCLRLRFHVLSKLTKENLTFEMKTELGGYVKCEKNLIVLNSMFSEFNKLKTSLGDHITPQNWMPIKDTQALEKVMDFSLNQLVSSFVFKSFLTGIGMNKKFHDDVRVKNNILEMFSHFPLTVFEDDNKKRQQFIQNIRMLKSANSSGDKSVTNFNFIKPSKKPIKLV